MDYKNIEDFAAKIGLPEEALAASLPVCRMIIEEYSDKYAELSRDIGNKDIIYKTAKKAGLEKDLTMLAFALLLGIDCHHIYEEKGLDDELYYAGMREITVWEKTCQREHGHVGFYEYGWLCNFLKAEIVRLNRLEFHIIHYNESKKWVCRDLTVRKGDNVINMHIPEDGKLYPELVRDSILRAYRHFGCKGTAAFVCESWLLYPGFYEFLPEDSNIKKFMDIFDITDYGDVKNCGDLWRVFGHRDSYDPATLPRDTGFRRGLADYLASHDNVTGWGFGIFACDGEEIFK